MDRPEFYTDVHISLEAVYQLRRKGVDTIHCGDVGMSEADDVGHLRYAIENGRVMVSCDIDFENIHAHWLESGKEHGGIVYFRMADQCQSTSVVVREILFYMKRLTTRQTFTINSGGHKDD